MAPKKLSIVLSVIAVLIVSFAVSTIPASNALIQRDFNLLNDQHLTVLTGNTKICGDHICARGEWQTMHEQINKAQLGHKGNSTTPTDATVKTPTNMPTQTQVTLAVCQTVKITLTDAAISSTVIAKVMADLGCTQS